MLYDAAFRAVRIACDNCEYEPPVGFESFREGARWAKDNGWISQKGKDGEYEHVCPDCQRKMHLIPDLPEEPPAWYGKHVPDFP